MLGLNVEAKHTSLVYNPSSEVCQDWSYIPVGPNLVPGGKNTVIHVCVRPPNGILARICFGPKGSGPIGMGARTAVASIVEIG